MSTKEKRFTMRRTYLKDVSFESPLPRDRFKERVEPKVELSVGVSATQVDDERHEVAVTCTVTARIEDETLYVCEVKQAGMFLHSGYSDAELLEILNIGCPAQLFPFARAELMHLTMLGGFPPVLLAGIDFEAMYRASQRGGTAGEA